MAPGDPLGKRGAGHAFISYVREDSARVDQLQQALEAAGIPVWRDTEDLWPGEDWRAKIRQAITDGALVFIACFSAASISRGTSYQNEELNLAIEQLRLRRPDDPWLIPARLDECEIPDHDLGGGRTLASIQRADLFGDRPGEKTERLVAAVRRILERTPGTASAPPAPGPAAAAGPARRPWWRVAAATFRRPALTGTLIAAALLAIVAYLVPRVVASQGSSTVTGSVVCESGRPVIAIWIAASTGQSDSGYAHLGPPGFSGISSPIGATGTYSYRLAHGGTYAVHVGCGGTAHHWAATDYSPLLSARAARLHCYNPARPADGASVTGECMVTTAS